MSEFYDKYGKSLELMEWARLFEDKKYVRVSYTKLWWGGRVSTIWLGLNHGWGNSLPLYFETMVFGTLMCGDPDEMRYSGLADARNGHIKMVKKWNSVPFLIVYLYTELACFIIDLFKDLKTWITRKNRKY